MCSSDLPKGCYAQIYIYESGDYPGDGQWLYSFLCRAQEDGMLTPVNGVIELATGLYNFYATSSLDSISDQGPDFSKYTGLANGLSNNVDYLWWKDENMYISKNEEAIPIEFERCCAKLTFLLTADTGDTLDEVTQFNITTGDPNKCYFSLRSGNISTTTSLTTSKQACTIVDTTASIIILPLNTNINLSALIEATVNGTSGWYTESIPLWFTDNYRAGYDYVYEIEFK